MPNLMSKIASGIDSRRLSIVLTIVAVLFYTFSLLQARFEIGYFGAIHGLPISFFVSLSLLTIAAAILWVSPQPHGKLMFLQLMLFVVAMYVTPLAVWGPGASTPNAGEIYMRLGWPDYVVRNGHISPDAVWTFAWPAESLLGTALISVLGIEDLTFLVILDIFLWLILSNMLVYLFLRTVISNKQSNWPWAGTWIFAIINPFTYSLMASHYGYLMLLLVMILLASFTFKEQIEAFSFEFRIVLIIIILVMPTIHLLTSITVLGMFVFLLVMRKKKNNIAYLIGILAVGIAAWSIFVTNGFLEARLPGFIGKLFRFDLAFQLGVIERFYGNESHQAIVMGRLLLVVIALSIGIAGAITGIKGKNNTLSDKFVLVTLIGMCTMAVVISAVYESELVQRAYMFALPAIAYFGVKLLRHRITAIVFTVLLLLALPLHYIYQYGNAVYDTLLPEDIAATHFFHRYTNGGYVTGAIIVHPIGFINNIENYTHVPIEDLRWENDSLVTFSVNSVHFIYLRETDEDIYQFLFNDSSLVSNTRDHLDKADNIEMIYTNKFLSIYTGQAH